MKQKRLTASTPAKITAYVLLGLGVLCLIACVAGVATMWDLNVYTVSKARSKTETFQSVAYSESDDVALLAYNGDFSELDYRSVTGNAVYRVTGEGAVLYESPDFEGMSELYAAALEVSFGNGYHVPPTPAPVEADMDEDAEDAAPQILLVETRVNPGMHVWDEYRLVDFAIDLLYALRFAVYPLALLFAALIVACFVFLLCGAGHRSGAEGITPGYFTRIPLDLLTAALVLSLGIGIALVVDLSYSSYGVLDDVITIVAALLLILAAAELITLYCAGFALRVKLGAWWQNTVIYRLLRWLWRGCRLLGRGLGALARSLPLFWKTLLALAAIFFIMLLWFAETYWDADMFLLGMVVGYAALSLFVLYLALVLRRLQKGGRALAAGDLGYQTDTRHLFGDFKEHAENLNSIGLGMTRAVEERLKSERLKTELITNVSHDIKTPLTSIINYTNLICETPCENEQIKEYSAVLLRQSERLKKLMGDLVDASKASTGNVEVLLAPFELGVLLTQTAGEYQQRLQECGLELIARQPEEGARVMADGRLLWRVFDNLMNNICKYALPGTRVYLTLEKQDGKALVSFKNTSRCALDVSAEELLERFVRGDSARSTEGSGLGLSIARSLTELQGGALTLTIDGDLFKAVLSFDTLP